MALFNAGSEAQTQKPANAGGKARLSMFSFGSSSSIPKTKTKAVAPISTSPNSTSSQTSFPPSKNSARSPTCAPNARCHPLNSPACSPVAEDNQLSEYASSHIFERSVQDTAGQVKQEDYIPPALDATAQILSDKDTDLDDVEVVYSTRRNSSVIGLNMALGRPYTPSRKNSVYMPPNQNMASSANNIGQSMSQSSLTFPQAGAPQGQTQSPVSPKLMSSRSSVSFYSYADMLNNDEFARRPSLMQAYSHGAVPQRKLSVTSSGSIASNGPGKGMDFNKNNRRAERSYSQSQLSKQFKDRPQSPQSSRRSHNKSSENSQKFLISPESSDSEEHEETFYPAEAGHRTNARRRSIVSDVSNGDNDSFVSTSVGDCIRECTTEISGV